MNRFSLFVDAGYFYKAGALAAFDENLPRENIGIMDPRSALDYLVDTAREACGNHPDLLRTYWYDGVHSAGLSTAQSAFAVLPSLKMRLGTISFAGKQKGVDSLIVADLIELSRNKSISDAVLLTGDEDIRVGVELAQGFGVRVHLLGVADIEHNVGKELRWAADTVTPIEAKWFRDNFRKTGVSSASLPDLHPRENSDISVPEQRSKGNDTLRALENVDVNSETLDVTADRAITALMAQYTPEDYKEIQASINLNGVIPPEIDRPLIAAMARIRNGQCFTKDEMALIRQVLRDHIAQSVD